MATTTRGDELLHEIWQRPGDRELLSVYADWLAAEGDAPRAEYIQLSLMPKRSPAQEKRRQALRKRHRGHWLGAARRHVYTWLDSEETPGFVGQAQCSFAKLAQGFDDIRRLGPRLVVNATEPKARREVVALAKLPLGTLYGLSLYENDAQWISDDLLTTLAPALRGLRYLDLYAGEARASDRGWAAVVPHLDALEHLNLTMGDHPEAWIEAMLASPTLPRTLRWLSVPGWIANPLRKRLSAALPQGRVEFRRERRQRFNRATGYYIP